MKRVVSNTVDRTKGTFGYRWTEIQTYNVFLVAFDISSHGSSKDVRTGTRSCKLARKARKIQKHRNKTDVKLSTNKNNYSYDYIASVK